MSSTASRWSPSCSIWLTRLAGSGLPLSIQPHSFYHQPPPHPLHLPHSPSTPISPDNELLSVNPHQACTSWGWGRSDYYLQIAPSSCRFPPSHHSFQEAITESPAGYLPSLPPPRLYCSHSAVSTCFPLIPTPNTHTHKTSRSTAGGNLSSLFTEAALVQYLILSTE